MEYNIELKPDENLLIGSWKMDDGKVVGDEVCERIEKLKKKLSQKSSR